MFIHLLVCISKWLDHSFRCVFGSVPHILTKVLQIVTFFQGSEHRLELTATHSYYELSREKRTSKVHLLFSVV